MATQLKLLAEALEARMEEFFEKTLGKQNEDGIFKITFSRKSLSKIGKHSCNVFPLEAFGLLIGTTKPSFVYAALPVGKTSQWDEPSGRFHGIERAVKIAENFAYSMEMEVIGLYHSHSADRVEESPLAYVPSHFIQKPVMIKPIRGGEIIFGSYCYLYTNEKWQEIGVKKDIPSERELNFNPKRILSKWNKIWKPSD